jgi:hypothetical protein
MSKLTKEKKIKKPIEIELTEREGYSNLYSTGIFTGIQPKDAFIIFFQDRPEPTMVPERFAHMRTKKIIREKQVEVHMSPQEFKEAANFMVMQIKRFENTYGKITLVKREENKPVFGPV